MSGHKGRLFADRDVLDRACERIWFEIRGLLPRYRRLHELGPARSIEQARELSRVSSEVARLKRRSLRYRDVLRDEACSEDTDDEPQ